jgi:predicted metal-binding membrane protein
VDAFEHGVQPPGVLEFEVQDLRPTLLMALVAALVVVVAWVVTVQSSPNFQMLIMAQLSGPSVTDTAAYVALSGVMMTAMMLPSALPMVAAYAAFERAKGAAPATRRHSALFSAAYVAVWAAVTALSLVALAGLGLMGSMGGPAALAPGLLLLAAGAYQFTRWKQYCLEHCRTPLSFLVVHYRPGNRGALRMGLSHACYCLGCCWLLMLVWFVAAAMSALWMGVFGAFILAEKAADRGGIVSRAMGVAAVALGALALYSWWATPAM